MPLFFGASFLLGGILLFAEPFLKEKELPFLFITTAAYLILYTGIRLCKYLKGKSSLSCDVKLVLKDRERKVKGLYDTGNCLLDTQTGKPVCVMEYSSFEGLLDREQREALEHFCAMNLEEGKEQMGKGLEETTAQVCALYQRGLPKRAASCCDGRKHDRIYRGRGKRDKGSAHRAFSDVPVLRQAFSK